MSNNSTSSDPYTRRLNLKNYHQADLVGPGVWYVLHLLAHDISTGDIKRAHMDTLIIHIRGHFPCLECRSHFSKMTDENPLSEVTTDKVFEKTFQYHNKVNHRSHKNSPVFKVVNEWFCGDSTHMHLYFPIKHIGMGMWWILHSTAAHNVSLFEVILRLLKEKLWHSESRAALSVISTQCRGSYPSDVWELHDRINRQLDLNSSPELRDVLKFFSSDEGCKEGCTAASRNKNGMMGRYVSGVQ